MIRVAAFNGLDCHHEMIGYILAHCQSRPCIALTVFTTSGADLSWITLYCERFPGVSFQSVEAFLSTNFDHIVLLTDDDRAFPVLVDAEEAKVLCIDHFHRLRRNTASGIKRISTRYFPDRLEAQYVLPTYCLVSKDDKMLALSSASGSSHDAEISIVCIGAAWEAFSTQQQFVRHVQTLFPMNVSPESVSRPLHFHLFHRRLVGIMIGEHSDGRISVTPHVAADAQCMIATLCKSDYVLIDDGAARQLHALSGSCPLAYSCGCRLITSALWKVSNNLSCPLVVPLTDALEAIGDRGGVGINLVYNEASNLWAHRDAVLASFLVE